MAKISKMLTLKKAWLEDERVRTFEEIVAQIADKLKDKRERRVEKDLFRTYEIADIKKSKASGFFVRIHGADDNKIRLVNKGAERASDDLEEHEAPEDRAFLHAEIIFYVVGNDVVFCDLAGKEGIVENLFECVLSKVEQTNSSIKMRLSGVPNRNEIERINRIGVKSVDFGLEGFLGNIDSMLGSSIIEKIFGGIPDGRSAKDRANARGRIVLTNNALKKEEVHKNEWLTRIGRDVFEQVDDYKIILDDKSEILPGSLRVSKKVYFDNLSGGISYQKAQLALENYYLSLQKSGLVGN